MSDTLRTDLVKLLHETAGYCRMSTYNVHSDTMEKRARKLDDAAFAIAAGAAPLVKERELLQQAADGLYNGFEPDNQSALWLRINAFLKSAPEDRALQSASAPSIGEPCPTCGEKFFGDLTGIEWHDIHVQYQRLVNRVLDEVEAMRRGTAITYATGEDPVPALRKQSPSDEQLNLAEQAVNKVRSTDRTTQR